MLSKKCTHIRIRDSNDYDLDIERFIKSLEKEYKVDFRTLPRWEDLVQRLHVSSTDCKRKIQDAYRRKALIVQKLYMQSTRPSPFQLTDGLCRTADKWSKMELDRKRTRKVSEVLTKDVWSESVPITEEFSETFHPNTENISLESGDNAEVVESKTNIAIQAEPSIESTNLPDVIITNPHKLISPMGSQFSGLSYRSLFTEGTLTGKTESEKEEWQCFKQTSAVKCTPSPISLTNDALSQQVIKFTLTNCTCQSVFVRLKYILDKSYFRKIKILPIFQKKLCPGLPEVFTLIFKLVNQEEFKTGIYFKIGFDVYDNVPAESLCVPIISEFTKGRCVIVSENINIPPVYPWHLKTNDQYSSEYIHITLRDPFPYHLHIYKRVMDLSQEPIVTIQADGVKTEIVTEKIEQKVQTETVVNTEVVTRKTDKTLDTHKLDNKTKVSMHSHFLPEISSETRMAQEAMASIAQGIIELALDTFMLESTYLYLKPHEITKIPVYFTKVEHTGYHQSYYDFLFIDTKTEEVAMKKIVKIYAEVLPHPIKVQPVILDMSKSSVKHGYCEDIFVVSNTHRLYPAIVKIKLTTKMKKMFYVEPMKTTIPGSASVPFSVKFCSRDFLSVKPSEDLVHFTFKIVINGYKAVYENIPPYFYEVIAPCAVEFKKVYNEKFFKEEGNDN
ncbi:uncharacterized protein LOC111350176 [Spodoptera litura]|uniref:Uncharacterized protein LOC111350176 n=1 Tax=Spodoptera litura TaxID=69820 RepID=A0A9J7DVF1_SPOLT|nr:uncharacterized protein LOC111350176 [Spodoptera litura]